jgi:hypothetical protein
MVKEPEFTGKAAHSATSKKGSLKCHLAADRQELVGDYRPIEENLERPLYYEELNLIQALHERFSRNDFFIQINNSGIVFWLRSIDLNGFKADVSQLLKHQGLDKTYQTEKNPFLDIIDKVECIGSYGIKGGKRIYVRYNRERKVKNRKSKILQRCTYFYAKDNDFTKEINEVPEELENIDRLWRQ